MQRLAVLLALGLGCEARGADTPPPIAWAYAPPPIAWQLGAGAGRFGRGQAAQPVAQLGITGAGPGLRLPTPWAIPGDGPALAAVFGLDGDRPAVELVDVDAGRVVWRDRVACAGPIVGTTTKAIVCADAKGTRAIGVDGKPRWRSDATFIAMTDERVVTAAVGEAVIVDADSGDELSRVRLPAGITAGAIVASCGDAGRELFAVANDKLVRIAEAPGGPKIAWAAPIGELLALDACEGTTAIASLADHQLVAFSRDKGSVTGRVAGVRGFWSSGARLGVASAAGVASYARDLTGWIPTQLPVLGELVAKRGARRLVRATPHTAVILDGMRPVAYVPFAALGGVLGDRAIVAGTWTGSAAETLHRFALPPLWTRHLRVTATPGVAVPAELRDLPAAVAPTGATETSLPAALALALDPDEPSALYAAVSGTLARADLAGAWRWERAEGCPPEPIALAISRTRVACASRAQLRASDKAGAPAWTAALVVDALEAAGELVLVRAADRAVVLDARDGHRLGELASDDGAPVRAAVIARGDATWLVAAERGRLVARLPRAGMLPVWSLAVAGTVASIQPSGEGVLVALDDGDAYRIELATTRVIALPGLGLAWQASGELVLGETVGGPLPAPLPPPAPAPKRVGPPPKPDPEAPPMSVPIVPPPSLGDSHQLALFELHGGLRARNDYAIAGAIGPRVAGAPLVFASGREALVLEPRRGDPVAHVLLPDRASLVFSTVVNGKPVAGALLADPLGFVLF